MRNSSSCSMKHTHLFHSEEDQRSQVHKKIVQDRLKSNNSNFVIREVPMQRLFNVGHCANASSDYAGFTKGKSFSAMDYDMPELVVFIQEDHQQQFVKDICTDHKGVSLEGKCLFDPNMNSMIDYNLGIMETKSINSAGSECVSQYPSVKEAMTMHEFRNLMMMKGGVGLDSGNKISIDHPIRKTRSETLREAFKRERNFTRPFNNWQINSILGTIGNRVEYPHCAECAQVTETSMPEMSYPQSPTEGSGKGQEVDYPQETCNCALGSPSGHAQTSSIASHQSNDSISSSNSFSFPILPVEWSGSPVRMVEADNGQSRKNRWRKICFPCCNGDC